MARKVTTENGHDRLNEAMTMLIQNQAVFLSQMAENEHSTSERFARIDDRFARIDERFARIDERFARIEQDMTAVLRVLAEHSRLLERLPEAVRDKLVLKAD